MHKATGRIARSLVAVFAGGLLAFGAMPASAQVRSVDPDKAIDGDLVPLAQQAQPAPAAPSISAAPVAQAEMPAAAPAAAPAPVPATANPQAATYHQDDLIGAAEGVFGKGAKGLADMIKDLLAKQGEPNGYIVGREGGGAIVVGVRYGSGTLYHKIEGQKPVYWTGRPSALTSAQMPATPSCWSITSTTRKTCSPGSARARGRPISSAGSM